MGLTVIANTCIMEDTNACHTEDTLVKVKLRWWHTDNSNSGYTNFCHTECTNVGHTDRKTFPPKFDWTEFESSILKSV